MRPPLSPGVGVQTPFGKGTVRAIRNNGRVVVDVKGRALVLRESDVSPLDSRKGRSKSAATSGAGGLHPRPAAHGPAAPSQIDLHGLTVDEALAAAERALNDALLADMTELRFIHGKSGGRIRAALHRWLGGLSSVRGFRLDERNEGVTVVVL